MDYKQISYYISLVSLFRPSVQYNNKNKNITHSKITEEKGATIKIKLFFKVRWGWGLI